MRERTMLGVLLGLCALFSLLTYGPQPVAGPEAARRLAASPELRVPGALALAAVRGGPGDADFLRELTLALRRRGVALAETLSGDPAALRAGLERLAARRAEHPVVLTLDSAAPGLRAVLAVLPELAGAPLLAPPAQSWPTFLLKDNFLNIANQIAVIAILAIGMTAVIITAGIDLSVGSLIALSAVVAAWLIGRLGGTAAGAGGMLAGGALAVLLCGLLGAFSGLMVTRWRVPPFIATLGMMQVASGLAYLLSQGRPIYQVPAAFTALGRGADPWLGLPWAVLLMAVLYLLAHLVMTRTVLGRHIYAVGGNAEAARLAGVPVARVLMVVYTACAALAGLGGVLMASQLKSGAPTYGVMYELYVIAAVVVGGTSLSGGQGRIAGTLVGAFIIAVIQNGMNLTNVESYTQKVVLGLVILGAVLIERIRARH